MAKKSKNSVLKYTRVKPFTNVLISCLFIFLLRKIRAGLSGRRMHGEETNEFWGDLLKGNYAYDEAEDEPVKRSLHRN